MWKPRNSDIANGQPWCIAGGYAACPQLASDMDVWIMGFDKDDLDDFVARTHIAFPTIVAEENPERNSPEAYFGACYTLKVGFIPGRAHLPQRHILATSAVDVYDLLEGFDISTHKCAFDSDGRFITGAGYTPIWEPPKILKVGGTATVERYSKIHARYAHFREGLNGLELEVASV